MKRESIIDEIRGEINHVWNRWFYRKSQAAPILLDGLSKLEYRGYDSAGMAVRDGENLAQVVKAKGRLSNLIEKTDGGQGIERNLWDRSYPLGNPRENQSDKCTSSCHCKIRFGNESRSLVYITALSRIIQELKEKLLSMGYTFYSQTDTEVVVSSWWIYYKKYNLGPIDALRKTWCVSVVPMRWH